MHTLTRYAIKDPATGRYLLPRDCSYPRVFMDDATRVAIFTDVEAAAAHAGLHVQHAKRCNETNPHLKPEPTRLVIVPVVTVIGAPEEEIIAE